MNRYNPKVHHRRSIRLKGYDYSMKGAYFVTICCQNRICRFGKIVEKEMILNEFGQIAYDEWIKLSERFTNFELDVFQIMPNHMHGIIVLNDPVGQPSRLPPMTITPPINDNINNNAVANIRTRANSAPTIGDIVGAYKSLVANACLEIFKSRNEIMGKLWQRNYYEHIIRNKQSYQTISNYILNNPAKWDNDKFNAK